MLLGQPQPSSYPYSAHSCSARRCQRSQVRVGVLRSQCTSQFPTHLTRRAQTSTRFAPTQRSSVRSAVHSGRASTRSPGVSPKESKMFAALARLLPSSVKKAAESPLVAVPGLILFLSMLIVGGLGLVVLMGKLLTTRAAAQVRASHSLYPALTSLLLVQ